LSLHLDLNLCFTGGIQHPVRLPVAPFLGLTLDTALLQLLGGGEGSRRLEVQPTT
jgi:hypothetical protein